MTSRTLRILVSLSVASSFVACGGDDDGGATVALNIEVTDILSDEIVPDAEVCQFLPTMGECATADAAGLVSLQVPAEADVAVRFTHPMYYPLINVASTRGVDYAIEADIASNFAVVATAATIGMEPADDKGQLLIIPTSDSGADLSGMTFTVEPPDSQLLYFNDSMVPDATLTASSPLGLGAVPNISPGMYTVTWSHPTLSCAFTESGWLTDDPKQVRTLVEAGTATAVAFLGCE